MIKRIEKGKHRSKVLLVTTAIVILIAMGVSYGHWSESLDIFTSVSTGKMDVIFCDNNYYLDVKKGNHDLIVSFSDDNKIMNITGTVGHDFQAFLHYCVKNTGDIPVKLTGSEISEGQEFIIALNHQNGVLSPQEVHYSANGNPKIHVAVETLEEGTYTFRAELEFCQWNACGGSIGWQDELDIIGSITVEAPPEPQLTGTDPSIGEQEEAEGEKVEGQEESEGQETDGDGQ